MLSSVICGEVGLFLQKAPAAKTPRVIALLHCNVSVLDAGGIKKVADHDPHRIDTVPVSRCSAGKIKLSEDALAVEEAVEVAIRVREAAHDKTLGVDAERR